jgi:hypothetical protein
MIRYLKSCFRLYFREIPYKQMKNKNNMIACGTLLCLSLIIGASFSFAEPGKVVSESEAKSLRGGCVAWQQLHCEGGNCENSGKYIYEEGGYEQGKASTNGHCDAYQSCTKCDLDIVQCDER